MPLVVADRVQETTNTTGTGTLTLAGASSGFRTFSAGVGNANTTYYTIVSGSDWEVGLGTYTSSGNTLSRDTVLESSAGGATKITVAAGATVFATYPADKAVYLDANNNIGLGMANDGSAFLQIAAGTATKAPLELTAGTLMTTPDGGSIEYDGAAFYTCPVNSRRGISPSEYYYRLNSGFAGSNATGAQSMFGVGITLDASTQYEFEILFLTNKTAGTTSHTFSMQFGGTATVNNIAYYVMGTAANSAFPISLSTGSPFGATLSTASFQIRSAVTSAATSAVYLIKGTVSINAGGTFIPQYSLSAAPGGAYTTQIGSYVWFKPIAAAGSNVSVGGWA